MPGLVAVTSTANVSNCPAKALNVQIWLPVLTLPEQFPEPLEISIGVAEVKGSFVSGGNSVGGTKTASSSEGGAVGLAGNRSQAATSAAVRAPS